MNVSSLKKDKWRYSGMAREELTALGRPDDELVVLDGDAWNSDDIDGLLGGGRLWISLGVVVGLKRWLWVAVCWIMAIGDMS